jgi:transcriptional regulator with XRE-family HTH domain
MRAAREAIGLSRNQLADQAGVGKTALFDLEHGNPGVRLNTLLAVLQVLGMSLRLDGLESVSSEPREERAWAVDSEDLPDRLL